ncbi:MAG: gliding motility lipoprotein GldH [Bacteroidetes bacterium]|nr:gliding motility lipoprotein GldH [Bacteroidota bacterium]
MQRNFVIAVAAVLMAWGCSTNKNVLLDEFKEVGTEKWSWNDARTFTFTVTEADYLYNLDCSLRITGNYKYSNIWLIYQLEGPEGSTKQQFQITLSDNTGKWLGKGNNNLISYKQNMVSGLKLKPGKYTLKFNQNMRDENLEAVSDIGLKVYKGSRIF